MPREERLDDGRWIYSREHSIKHGGLVSVLTDVTLIKESQAVYEKRASEDVLTGLVNRQGFRGPARAWIRACQANGEILGATLYRSRQLQADQ